MNIALLGNGKTGSMIIPASLEMGHYVETFNSTNPPSIETLSGHDVIISFLPGNVFFGYIELLIDTGIPVVSGSTGFQWEPDRDSFHQRLANAGLHWVHTGNFSMGNAIVMNLLQLLNVQKVPDGFQMSISETHHAAKIDSPSGTAILWKDQLNAAIPIKSSRYGDVIGIHELHITSHGEHVTLRHEVTDRNVFAKGALHCASILLEYRSRIPAGLYDLQQLTLSTQHLH